MKTVIVAEKPSQAKAYAAAFQVRKTESTHIELASCDTFPHGAIITWGIGHLVEIALPGEHDEKWEKWNLENLPVMPAQFQLKVANDKKPQFNAVKKLLKEADLICNACDIDREGSNIFYLILKVAGVTNTPIKRLWINSLEADEIRKGFKNLQDNKKDVLMYQEAHARQIADWLVGMNGSPLYSLLLQQKGLQGALSIGRCQTPLVKMIYDRQQEIKNFVSTPFYELIANVTTSSHFEYKAKAKFKVSTRDELNAFLLEKGLAPGIELSAEITSVEKVDKRTQAPKLHSLSTLQATANKKWKYSPKMVLDTVQSLYETHKLLTYPRTDCNFITEAEFSYLVENVAAYQQIAKANFAPNTEPKKRYVDNSKVAEHFAIIPTKTATDASKLTNLTPHELNVFNEVLRTTLAMFHTDYLYEETTIITAINDVEFFATGKVEKDKGWKALFDSSEPDEKEDVQKLPAVQQGEAVQAIVTEHEGMTKPPKPYSEGQLIQLMKTAGKAIEDEEAAAILKEVEGIGTEATRAGIIETVKNRGYIDVTKNIVSVTAKGEVLCQALANSIVSSPELTAKWESKLRLISAGQLTLEQFVDDIKGFIHEMIVEAKTSIVANTTLDNAVKSAAPPVQTIGKCPVCKQGEMVDRGNFIGCNRYKEGCKFSINRTICKKKITDTQIRALLEKGKTALIKGFVSKKETKFDAHLKLNAAEGIVEFEFAKK